VSKCCKFETNQRNSVSRRSIGWLRARGDMFEAKQAIHATSNACAFGRN